jgi:hypothetical protein
MAAYSLDLRQRILSAWQNKENTQRGLAKRFKVSLSFVRDFLRRYRETNEIAAKPQGGDGLSKIKGEDEELLKKIVFLWYILSKMAASSPEFGDLWGLIRVNFFLEMSLFL